MAINKLDTGAIQDNAITNAKMADDAVGVADLAATGTPSSTTFLRGDNAWVTPTDTNTTYSVQDGELSQNNFTNDDHTKLNNIEASATADQTNDEIKAAVEAASDSNIFTDADHTKLNAIEASADVTDATNVAAAGALMDSELAGIAAVKATTGTFLTADQTKLDGIAASANNYVHPNHSGDVVSAADGAMTIQTDAVDIAMLSATGTPSATTFLRGDNVWTTVDTTTIENNIAMLGFYRATDHSKAKYDLVDQVIDDYNDASGIDASASTNENLSSGSYGGQTSSVGSATGGTITTSGNYKYHLFVGYDANAHTNWNFVTPSTGTIDYLIVGAGGSGRSLHSGSIGGGSGGSSQYFSGQSKTAGTYPIVVAGPASGWTTSTNGLYSSAFGTSKAGGTLGAITSGAGPAGTTYSAFSQFGDSGVFGGGGGSQNNAGGTGGGGYGGNYGGNVNAESGQANTGGGGGSGNSGSNASGDGGSGVVLVRYLTDAFTTYAVSDLTLQSTDSTASTAPTSGDMVTLIENSAGTATLNTDIKGYISRDSGVTFTQGTLVDEGSWGTNKKILAFHNLDISGQPSGTSMCYKITTHNQSASKETKIHATSLAWA